MSIQNKLSAILVGWLFSICVWAQPVNINTASAAEISSSLIGIGTQKAQAIVDYRTEHGAFTSVEELKSVKGIGAKTLEKNAGDIQL
jgi:competence protein ComEA